MDRSVRCFKNARPRAELLEKASTSWGTEESVRRATVAWELGWLEKPLRIPFARLESDSLSTSSHWPWDSIRMTDVLMSPTVLRCSGYCSTAHCLRQCPCPATGYCSVIQSSSRLHAGCTPRGRVALHLTYAQSRDERHRSSLIRHPAIRHGACSS